MLKPTDIDVRTVMSAELFSLSATTSLAAATQELLSRGMSGAPVLDGERLSGEIDVSDLLRATTEGKAPETPLSELARPTTTCEPGTHLIEACKRMIRAHAHRLVVSEEGRLLGLISAIDVVRALAALDPKAIRWDPITQTIELTEE